MAAFAVEFWDVVLFCGLELIECYIEYFEATRCTSWRVVWGVTEEGIKRSASGRGVGELVFRAPNRPRQELGTMETLVELTRRLKVSLRCAARRAERRGPCSSHVVLGFSLSGPRNLGFRVLGLRDLGFIR